MKEFKKIMAKIESVNASIKECKERINALEMKEEIHLAFARYESKFDPALLQEVKKLQAKRDENTTKIIEESEKHYYLCVLREVLKENARYELFTFAKEFLTSEFAKINGKQYGEKTKEKMRALAREKGFCFWFDGHLSGGDNMVHISPVGIPGTSFDVEVYGASSDNTNCFFITSDNKINVANVLWKPYNLKHYENPTAAAKKIVKEIRKYNELTVDMEKKRRALSDLIPASIKSPEYIHEYKVIY